MVSQLLNAKVACSLDHEYSASVRRFVVDERLSVTVFQKSGVIAVARYGLTGGAHLYPVSRTEARVLLAWLDALSE